MDKIKRKLKICLAFGIFFSLSLPIGVIMLCLGFTSGRLAMGIVGIIFSVLGFYGTPLIWVRFAMLVYYKRIYMHVKDEKIRSVKIIANMHNKKPKFMANDIRIMIQKGYFTDIILLDNERIIDKSEMSDTDYSSLEAHHADELKIVHCPFCNAQTELINGIGTCTYCGSKITDDMLTKDE